MRPTIDYLNARAASKPASGGKRYKHERNAVDDRAQYAQLDRHEQTMIAVGAVFAEFRSWVNNLPPVAAVMSGVDLDDTF